jgi:hypothetical protein
MHFSSFYKIYWPALIMAGTKYHIFLTPGTWFENIDGVPEAVSRLGLSICGYGSTHTLSPSFSPLYLIAELTGDKVQDWSEIQKVSRRLAGIEKMPVGSRPV